MPQITTEFSKKLKYSFHRQAAILKPLIAATVEANCQYVSATSSRQVLGTQEAKYSRKLARAAGTRRAVRV